MGGSLMNCHAEHGDLNENCGFLAPARPGHSEASVGE